MTEEEGPESPVRASERQSRGTRSFQDAELVTEGEDFSREGGPRSSEGNQGAERSLTTVSIRVRYRAEAYPKRRRSRSPEPSAKERNTVCRNPRDLIFARHRRASGERAGDIRPVAAAFHAFTHGERDGDVFWRTTGA